MSHDPKQRTPRDPAPRQVLDPAWEDELRAGQEQDGGAGSVEDELAALHLLRHLREPEALDPAVLDGIWASIEPEVAPKRWWQRAWFFVGAPALAGAVALLLVLRTPGVGDEVDGAGAGPRIASESTPASAPSGDAAAAAASPTREAMTASASALLLEQNFALLEPGARRALAGRVDADRAHARSELLARARGRRS
ncbi:MAG: hypothetical protein KC486_21325 [Myxococcales bacterium]|nr:hypothetical protein [Myxococcales bacterium]